MKRLMILGISWIAWSCVDLFPVSPPVLDPGSAYPTTLRVVGQSARDSLESRLDSALGTMYRGSLDEYGLMGYLGLFARGTSSLTDTGVVVSLAKSAVVRLGEFTNVRDPRNLVVRQVSHGSGRDWLLTFENQRYKNREVRNTEIYALVTDDYIQVKGHHYERVYLPPVRFSTEEQIREALVGKVISYWCWGPAEFTISEEMIRFAWMEPVIYPLVDGSSLQLRVSWKIPLMNGEWVFYLDVADGELIAIEQLFIC